MFGFVLKPASVVQLPMFSIRQVPQKVRQILQKFSQNNAQIYIVGGAVRDLYLKRPVKDWDFATNFTPQQMKKIFPANSFYLNDFGTFSIIGPKQEIFEVTTFRSESVYADFRHPSKVDWGKSIKEDLKRRDFTINTIALKPIYIKARLKSLEIIDPYDGLKDLDLKLIRAVGDPDTRFSEDAHRLIRAVRIAGQIGFTIEKNTLASIQKNSQLLEKISAERIRDDFLKILTTSTPSAGINLLKDTNLLTYIVPELLKGIGMSQKGHHIYDVWTHSLSCLDNCDSTSPITKLAALLHDVGKPYTVNFPNGPDSEPTFHNHEVVSGRLARSIGKRLRLSNKQLDQLYRLVRWHMFTADDKQTDKAVRRLIRHITPDYLDDLISLRRGDRLGSGAKETSWRWELLKHRFIEVQKQPFSVKDLKVTGNDVMEILKIKPGPKVGQILNQIFLKVADDPSLNVRPILLKMLHEYS